MSPVARYTCSWFDITDLKITQFLKRLSEGNMTLTENSEQGGDEHHPDMSSQKEPVDEASTIQTLARTMLRHVWKE